LWIMKSKKSHKGELNNSLVSTLWQCFESIRILMWRIANMLQD
jgi:hypothetical protein